jgi:hypothetical protein
MQQRQLFAEVNEFKQIRKIYLLASKEMEVSFWDCSFAPNSRFDLLTKLLINSIVRKANQPNIIPEET